MNMKLRRLGLWLVGVIVLLTVIGLILGNLWLPRKLESVVTERLKARGLSADWKSVTWMPIRGLQVDGLVIRQASGDRALVCKTGHVNVRMPLWRAFDRETRITHWSVRNETVTVGDADGEITLEDVTARCEMSLGKLIVHRFSARDAGLTADLKGEILLKKSPSTPKPFALKLRGLRGALVSLDFSDKGKRFKATGTFEVDMTGPAPVWKSSLNGAGNDVVWKGVKLNKAAAEAELSSADSQIRAALATPNGSSSATIRKQGWKETPFVFEGTLKDKSGREDTFNGSFMKRTLTIERLSGNADLILIAGDVPQLADDLPDVFEFTRFPDLDARGIRWDADKTWHISSIKVGGNSTAIIAVEKRKIGISEIAGTMSYDDKTWRIGNARGKVFGGDFSIEGNYRQGALYQSSITAGGLKLAEIKRAAGKPVGKETKGILSFSYEGSVRLKGREFDGSGTIRLDDAPVFEVPLLEEVYGLFSAIVPGAKHSGEGRFDAEFMGRSHILDVKRFVATGGSLSVTANGEVDLEKETVAGFARGNLGGPPGLLTKPIGKLLEMEVSGSLDKIQVKPVGPARSIAEAASGTAGKIVEGLEKAGEKIRGKEKNKDE